MTAADLPEADTQQVALDAFTAACLAGAPPDLDEFCRAHAHAGPTLRARLEEILYVIGHGHRVAARRPIDLPQEDHPERIGPYRIVEVLGEGGMGRVYLAEQTEPVRRRVALKVIKLGMDSSGVLKRFELERQALAVMNHDCIARVLDCGATERGQPWFALEYVPGIPLVEYCDRHALTIEQRLRLFQRLCDGVQHAHQKGVIHRDLKPGNVLVTEGPRGAVPKIIDFGLARATEPVLPRATLYTEQGRILGTPEYMSPEQADPASDVDTRTDIYSLGVMLYELLVGALPREREHARRNRAPAPDADTPRPSTVLAGADENTRTTAARRRTTPAALRRALRSDLDWVVLKAMERDRNRRYESASSLAMDVERFLTHEPLIAGPPGAGYRLRKLARRYRAQVVAGAAVFVTALVGAGVAIAYAAESERQSAAATLNAAKLSAKIEEFDMLALVVRLRRARELERELWPAWPEKAGAMRDWLHAEVEPLRAQLPLARAAVQTLRERAEAGSASDRFLRDALGEVVRDIDAFERDEVVAVQQRLRWAEAVYAVTVERWRARWDEARDALAAADGVVASTLYRAHKVALAPQVGLVPIGMNPRTGLWEFYDLRSAWDPGAGNDPAELAIPSLGADGSVAMTGDTGMVLVLLPGGSFAMGAQARDAEAVGYDPYALPDESPLREVALAPFFIARHEMTKGQWKRLSNGDEPSRFAIGEVHDDPSVPIGYAHPVEMVDWISCRDLLAQHGLALPTEAQWEYGCRAGTRTPWWTGAEARSLAGSANLIDRRLAMRSPGWGRQVEDFDDGFAYLAPVGSYGANPWGLFDMHGNLLEWCADWYDQVAAQKRDGDGFGAVESAADRVCRGGSFLMQAIYARSSYRHHFPPAVRGHHLGVRAVRALRE